jgi:nicotinate-nucleotide pyrophosphorylase (carboxylating)
LRDNRRQKAKVIAKEPGILAGIEEAVWFYDQYGVEISPIKQDGDRVVKGDLILELQGQEFKLLETERVGLNLIQRMSGIASLTNKLVKNSEPLLVVATRKTHWGDLDNKAVSVGGGGTHRLGLWESILIKENHLASLSKEGDFDVIEEALTRAWQNRDKAVFIEIEVVSIDDAIKAAGQFTKLIEGTKEVKPCVVMLDNFSPKDAAKTVNLFKEKGYYEQVLIEASGGITPENILAYRDAEVDVVSMGYLTHSPKALDISQLIVDI